MVIQNVVVHLKTTIMDIEFCNTLNTQKNYTSSEVCEAYIEWKNSKPVKDPWGRDFTGTEDELWAEWRKFFKWFHNPK